MNFKKFQYGSKVLHVACDYYFEDGIRMPVDLKKAWQIAENYGFQLPTSDMVDFIWQNADIRLDPAPLPPGPQMTTMAYFRKHNQVIEDQLAEYGNAEGKLIAGHKKDIVDHPKTSSKVAIYGWHRSNGAPIQPYSTVHSWDYKDYSHGLRFVKLEDPE